MGFWKDFVEETVETAVAGITAGATKGLLGEKTDLGMGLTEGTQSDFDKYVTARQAAVRGEYDKYTKKFDAFEEQAKQFADLVGSPSQQNLDTELDGMEVAARFMQGKSQAQIQDAIKKLQAIRDEGGNVREKISDLIKRGSGEEVRNYTAQDIARMQLGGGFKYTPKPYDLSKRRTGMARFLRDDFGLFGETFAKEREDLAERQARQVTQSLSGYDKYAATGTSPYTKAQASITFSAMDLRTEAEKRNERIAKNQESLSNQQVKNAKQTYDIAKQQEADRTKKFQVDYANSLLEKRYQEKQLSEQQYQIQKREAEDAISGTALKIQLGKAIEADRANPTKETGAAVLDAQQAVYNHVTSLNFYDRVKSEVDRRKSYDKRFESKKVKGDISIGTKDIAGFETAEAALNEERKIWEQAFVDGYKTLSPEYKQKINFKQFGFNLDESFAENVKEFFSLRVIGNRAYGKNKVSGLQELEAGIEAAYPNISAKEKKAKLDAAIVFAHQYKIQLTKSTERSRQPTTTSTQTPTGAQTGAIQERRPSSGLDTIPEDTGEEGPTQTRDIGDEAPKGFVQRRPIAIRGMKEAKERSRMPKESKKTLEEIEREMSILQKQLDNTNAKWTKSYRRKQQELYNLQSQRLELKRANQ